MKISEGFPKLIEEGGVTAKVYKRVFRKCLSGSADFPANRDFLLGWFFQG